MNGRYLSPAIAAAALMAALILFPLSGAAQTPTAVEKTWNPPRTADGQPDMQGFWANQSKRLATYDIEAAADERHVLFSGNPTDPNSLVVDPADGKIPYQPWARAKRQDVFDHHTDIT